MTDHKCNFKIILAEHGFLLFRCGPCGRTLEARRDFFTRRNRKIYIDGQLV